MDQRCAHCGALYFVGEDFISCMGENVSIPALPPLPNQLVALYILNNAQSKSFRNHIRLFNNMFAFASMNYDLRLPPGNPNPVFRVCGQIAHRVGPSRCTYMTLTRQSNRGYPMFQSSRMHSLMTKLFILSRV